jgi:hypothetical protein
MGTLALVMTRISLRTVHKYSLRGRRGNLRLLLHGLLLHLNRGLVVLLELQLLVLQLVLVLQLILGMGLVNGNRLLKLRWRLVHRLLDLVLLQKMTTTQNPSFKSKAKTCFNQQISSSFITLLQGNVAKASVGTLNTHRVQSKFLKCAFSCLSLKGCF